MPTIVAIGMPGIGRAMTLSPMSTSMTSAAFHRHRIAPGIERRSLEDMWTSCTSTAKSYNRLGKRCRDFGGTRAGRPVGANQERSLYTASTGARSAIRLRRAMIRAGRPTPSAPVSTPSRE